jgi:hypothetical protein
MDKDKIRKVLSSVGDFEYAYELKIAILKVMREKEKVEEGDDCITCSNSPYRNDPWGGPGIIAKCANCGYLECFVCAEFFDCPKCEKIRCQKCAFGDELLDEYDICKNCYGDETD